MILYYSGGATLKAGPEADLKEKANVMLTYHTMSKRNRPEIRFARILKARKKQKQEKQ